MSADPKLRYRIDLYTDARLRWFAQVEEHSEGDPGPARFWTPTAETWSEALALAERKIREGREQR